MREIKFRAWDKQEMKMAEVDAMDWGANGDIVTAHLSFLEGRLRRKVYPNDKLGDEIYFMQYTGLKDKNGKEIYEGDLIQYSDFPRTKMTYKVFWDRNAFHVQGIKDPEKWTTGLLGYDALIIGNIYENPELLI